MALTATILVDIVNVTETLTWSVGGSQIDQMVYASNTVTLGSTSGFSLSKSDLLLYIANLNLFNLSIISNFPSVQSSRLLSLPVSNFEIDLTSAGVTHINYVQSSQGNSVYSTNYVPIAQAASFAARSSVNLTMQEFFLMVLMNQQYLNQVQIN